MTFVVQFCRDKWACGCSPVLEQTCDFAGAGKEDRHLAGYGTTKVGSLDAPSCDELCFLIISGTRSNSRGAEGGAFWEPGQATNRAHAEKHGHAMVLRAPRP